MLLILGIVFIAIGLSIIINIIFGINLPIFKMLLAGTLIYWGIKMLLPSRYSTSYFSAFESYQTAPSDAKENYVVSFASSVIDLAYLTQENAPKTIMIDTRFANTVVQLPKDVPLRVKANVRFSAVNLPGHDLSSEYVNLHGSLEPQLTIYINSQFSNVVVRE